MCLNSPPETSEAPAITVSTERRGTVGVLDRMKRMLANGELSDIQFTVGRKFGPVKIFPAHKSILCNSSDVFCSMICNSVPESCPLNIHFPDIPSDAFANLLNYVYTDSVEGISADNVFSTLHCADKFDLPLLANTCCEYFIKHLNSESCLTTLENAIRWSPELDRIVEKCLDIVDASTADILRSEQFSSISHDCLQMILQRSTLSADENAVYIAADNWAVRTCMERNLEPTAVNQREVLGAALFLIRFPVLTDIQLAFGPIQSGLLLPTELRDIFLYKHGSQPPALAFPTEPRNHLQHRIGLYVYKHREAVFAQTSTGDWIPGEVLQTVGSEVVTQLYRQGDTRVIKKHRQIVRAADILQRCQRVQCLGSAAKYCIRRGGKHMVEVDGREVAVEFADLMIPEKVFLEWYAANWRFLEYII
ncbi:BTB/POZ domain-containing protein 6-B-like [Paramacrobiotus metropolitanus]|uniref:BTB/POZ domain-containing protein 6-B-like n=1 Tax=Paramacrobiotus metropolitanus TaxID=2943436 RepID=UPI002445E6C9|nr:BTB/POZ domain-containing protein 6-B-like [Paramacrobiotus metropolitanus]